MEKRRSSQKRMKSWLVPTIVIAAAAALFALASTGGSKSQTSANPKTTSSSVGQPAQPTGPARRIPGDPLAMGRVNAPVVLIEYSEFQCPFCGMFSRNTQPDLIKKYVTNGTLRIEWRDFPYLGPNQLRLHLQVERPQTKASFGSITTLFLPISFLQTAATSPCLISLVLPRMWA